MFKAQHPDFVFGAVHEQVMHGPDVVVVFVEDVSASQVLGGIGASSFGMVFLAPAGIAVGSNTTGHHIILLPKLAPSWET